MKKTYRGTLILVTIVLLALMASSAWMGLGPKISSPARPEGEVSSAESKKTKIPETAEVKSEKKSPLWIIRHYVSETEWKYAQKWNLTIPQWIERLGYSSAEEIKENNGSIVQGDWIKIPIYKDSFTGTASYYGHETKGTTATEKKWNPEEKLVASVFLPKSPTIERQTVVNVTNVRTGKTIKGVEVEDSGPYAYDKKSGVKQPRVLDLSLGLKKKLGCSDLCKVRYTIRSIPSKYNTLSALS